MSFMNLEPIRELYEVANAERNRLAASLAEVSLERNALAARVRDLEGLLGRVKVARDEGWYEDDPHWAEIDAGIAALAPTQRPT